MIVCKRHELVEAENAIKTLGKTYMPVEKERYWFIKTLSKLQKAVKQHKKQTNDKHNELLKQYGKQQDNGQVGLLPSDPEMAKYTEGMEDFMQEDVEVDVNQIPLAALEAAAVTMIAEDQVALLWLIAEDGAYLKAVK